MRCCCLLVVAFAASIGCQKDEPVRVYTAPKPFEVSYTILGAMFPADEPVWFFKVSGKAEELAPHAADFDKLMASVRFLNGPENMPLFDLPEGWTLGGENKAKMAAETFVFGSGERQFTLTLGKFQGGLEPNLKRWVEQVGATYTADSKAKCTRPIATKLPGLRVEVSGPQSPTARGMKPGR